MSGTFEIKDKVAQLLANVEADRAPWAQFFVQQVHERHMQAERAVHRYLTSFAISWLAIYAIGSGLVTEAQLAAVKIEQIQSLLVVAPLLLGFLS